jgi:hypothetical protein
MGFVATINQVLTDLKTAGLEAAADVRDLNPPGVLVTPATLVEPTKLCGTGKVRLFLDLVARDSGDTTALDQLEQLHDTVGPLVERVKTSDPATFTRRQAGTDPTALPSLRLTIETPTITGETP